MIDSRFDAEYLIEWNQQALASGESEMFDMEYKILKSQENIIVETKYFLRSIDGKEPNNWKDKTPLTPLLSLKSWPLANIFNYFEVNPPQLEELLSSPSAFLSVSQSLAGSSECSKYFGCILTFRSMRGTDFREA